MHSGSIVSTDGETFIESAWLSRNLTTTGDLLTDVYDTVVEGRLSVADAEYGRVVCGSEIDGDVALTGNSTMPGYVALTSAKRPHQRPPASSAAPRTWSRDSCKADVLNKIEARIGGRRSPIGRATPAAAT